jgi:hypothetical protein
MEIRVGLARSLAAIALFTVSATGAGLEQPDRIDPPTHPRATVVRGSPASTRVKSFGTQDSTLTVVSAVDFHAFFSTTEYTYSSGFRAATGPVNFQLGATFGSLPHGAVMESFRVYSVDNSATEELRFRACRNSRDTVSGDINLQECFVEYFTSGEPDFSVVELPVPAEFQNYLLVTDTDGDLDDDSVDYFFVVDTPGGLATAIGPVMIRWRRQVSPAPSLATFNDVPTSDSAFQFIEALAASGITAGCGGGNYCPDSPLTRRQMAVFLAKALGLHWVP